MQVMFSRFGSITLAIAAALVLPVPAHAWNIVKNGDFVGGASGWTLSSTAGGNTGTESFFGSPANGSLRLAATSANSTAHAEQCVDVSKWLALDFSLRQLSNGEYGGGAHPFTLDVYDGAACAGNKLATITLPLSGDAVDGNPVGAWIEVSVPGTPLPSGAASAKVNLDALAGPTGASYYYVDHVQVVPPDEIFPSAFDPDQ
jgi:hypothetical protein